MKFKAKGRSQKAKGVESRHPLLPEEGRRVAPGWWETNHDSRLYCLARPKSTSTAFMSA